MNMTSCKSCGVYLDMDVIEFPSDEECEFEDGGYRPDKVVFSNDGFLPGTNCPVCKTLINKNGES